MSETDPGGPSARHTAGEVGARRHPVGEAVRADESGSLNVPPTQRETGEEAAREAHRGTGEDTGVPTPASGRGSGEPIAGTSAPAGLDRTRPAAPPSSDADRIGEAAAEIRERRRPTKFLMLAAGTAVALIARRLLRRRRG
ncbi:hypothetical protein C1I98_22845 [Spongiactinospora gelatinilytica]|uniref:DUF3618 domain-containing protein n=1 Tax=Spongiactinospora gelatinilytica TaxID=2666298 RepID=A0A2W2FWF0_9ACTN|nr:hypothetical protein [Spongiactinospora gelatinilytica]PZG39992.1 hypothetical protein C1I98_22845 [Spongiactinospora gelatinilytica]